MNKNINFSFMAFGKAVESKEGGSIKRYIGASPVYVLAVNLTKEERNKLLNAEIDSEPEYLREREVDGKNVPQVMVTFCVKPDVEGDIIIPMTFFVDKSYRYNRDKTKVQVIDKYGYSAWATPEDLKIKQLLKVALVKPLELLLNTGLPIMEKYNLLNLLRAILILMKHFPMLIVNGLRTPK